ncbi:uridine phosphorylase 1 isoform X2 [Bacillus rossius redtenbacheri]|uniref:uridine phosphorylase 1 isoform X2 n=1 Tax=Bacillus rossius redtenbacheri TaxID=93214 RepID=UPI002FDE2DE6
MASDEERDEYADGSVRLRNPNIELMDQDILYHLALGSGSHDLVAMFGDVKFVCMGGTPKRVEQFAHFIMDEIGHKLPTGTTLLDISQFSYRYSMYKVGPVLSVSVSTLPRLVPASLSRHCHVTATSLPTGTTLLDISQFSYRYSMYKVGPVLSVSHGMGMPSVGILLHEVIKLMYHARVKDPVFFRIGTSGGIGLEGGTVVISEDAVDGVLQPYLDLPVLGKMVRRPAQLDKRLVRELKALADPNDPYDIVTGRTMCTSDFYEGQGRMDGAFCDFSEAQKMDFLNKVHKCGVVNIEMESLSFAALTHHAGIRSAVICVTIVDRLHGDQIMAPKEVLDEWQCRPQALVSRYIKRYLTMKGRLTMAGPGGSVCVKSPRRFKLVQQESENYD